MTNWNPNDNSSIHQNQVQVFKGITIEDLQDDGKIHVEMLKLTMCTVNYYRKMIHQEFSWKWVCSTRSLIHNRYDSN